MCIRDRCNGTPDTPDITAVVYCTTGRALAWSPRLSAGTSSPEPVEGVDDFSQHPKMCIRDRFYTNVCSNVSTQYDASEIAPRLKSELLNALQPALATLSANKVQYCLLYTSRCV